MSLILVYVSYLSNTAPLSSMQYFGDVGYFCMSQDRSIRKMLPVGILIEKEYFATVRKGLGQHCTTKLDFLGVKCSVKKI